MTWPSILKSGAPLTTESGVAPPVQTSSIVTWRHIPSPSRTG